MKGDGNDGELGFLRRVHREVSLNTVETEIERGGTTIHDKWE